MKKTDEIILEALEIIDALLNNGEMTAIQLDDDTLSIITHAKEFMAKHGTCEHEIDRESYKATYTVANETNLEAKCAKCGESAFTKVQNWTWADEGEHKPRGSCGCPFDDLTMTEYGQFHCPKHEKAVEV